MYHIFFMHSSGEVSQTQKDKYHMISLICRILKEGDSSELNLQNRSIGTDVENKTYT